MEKWDILLIDLNEKLLHSKDDLEKIKIEMSIKAIKDAMHVDCGSMRLIDLLKNRYNELASLYVKNNCSFISQFSNINCTKEQSELSLSKHELIELVRDFFGTCTNNEIYNSFMQEYNDRTETFSVENKSELYGGEAIYLPYYNRTYINLYKKNNFSDISALAHEYGHAIYNKCKYPYLFLLDNSRNITSEIIGTFFQLLCIDYFSHNLNFKSDATIENVLLFNRNVDSAYFLDNEVTVLNKLFGSKDNIFKIIYNYYRHLSPDKDLLDYIVKTIPTEEFMYISSYTIAVELLNIYRNDRKRLFTILFDIMHYELSLKENEYIDKLNKLGIIPNEHLNEFNNELKRKLVND